MNLSESIESKIKYIIDHQIKPIIALHRGEIEFVSFEDGIVNVELRGTCKGCPLSELTLKAGVESLLKENISEVSGVRQVNI